MPERAGARPWVGQSASSEQRLLRGVARRRAERLQSSETPIKLTESQRKLLRELDDSFKRGGDRHSPNAKSWTDRVKDLFK